MPETVAISISRALKLKNRVVKEVSRLDALLIEFNSTQEENREFSYNIRELYPERMGLAEKLVGLKTAISKSNVAIQKEIFELAECKAMISVLNRVNTRHGVAYEGYQGTRIMYIAQYRKQEIDKEIRRIEQEIDRIQDVLDSHNHRVKIEVDSEALEA
jgi:predicted  nucleic acid-binding Zn-ribbon protein